MRHCSARLKWCSGWWASVARREELLDRIESSLDGMRDLVVGFLWLAREARSGPALDPTPLGEVLDPLLSELEPRARDLGLAFEVTRKAEPEVDAPPEVLRIVLGNLLGNALAHADQGPVRVVVEEDSVAFSNPESALPKVRNDGEESFGFGLELVHDLCERFAWELQLASGREDRFEARLRFPQNA